MTFLLKETATVFVHTLDGNCSGFIFPEQFLGCIPALIEIEGILCSHLPGGDDDKVPAEGNLLIDDLISFPAIHELFVSDE